MIKFIRNLLKRLPEDTIVQLRTTRFPAYTWKAKVIYDAWGRPYVAEKWHSIKADGWDNVLYKDGTAMGLYDAQWKHISGPPVTFGEIPLE